MNDDHWCDYRAFKHSQPATAAYYDLVRAAFVSGLERQHPSRPVPNAIDLGCGGGELTRELRPFAERIRGVDSSPGLIRQAREQADQQLSFVESDVLAPGLFGQLSAVPFDLVTAAWLHNHLLDEEAQHRLAAVVNRLIGPGGRFVFLIPGDAFCTERTREFIAGLGWRQSWLSHEANCSRGVYSFAGSQWAEMAVWQPLWLASLYREGFELEFLDIKSLALAHGGLGDHLIEPPFEVLCGRRSGA